MANKDTGLATKQDATLATQTPNYGLQGLDLMDDLKVIDGPIQGLELDASDLKLPKARLMQPTSLEVTKGKVGAGTYYVATTQKIYPQLPCHLLYLGKSRVMWKANFKRGDEPLCRSLDSKTSTDGKDCSKCEYRKWEKKAEGDSKPACNMSYVWLAQTADEDKMDFRIIVPGASVSLTKDFLNKIAMLRQVPWGLTILLGSEFKENDKGAFYVTTYDIIGNVVQDACNVLGTTMEEIKAGLTKEKQADGTVKLIPTTDIAKKWMEIRDDLLESRKSHGETLMDILNKSTEMDQLEGSRDIIEGSVADDGTHAEGALF